MRAAMKPHSFSIAFSSLLLAVAAQEPRRDVSKAEVERPLETALAEPAPAPAKVAPGLVRWHADFASACRAARDSGRPVLLFQLLGRLDDALC